MEKKKKLICLSENERYAFCLLCAANRGEIGHVVCFQHTISECPYIDIALEIIRQNRKKQEK